MFLIGCADFPCIKSESKACKWSVADTILEAGSETLIFIDYGETKYGIDDGLYYETNPIMGRYPSQNMIDNYFITSLVLHPIISYVLPKPYRTIWQAGTIFIEINTLNNNHKEGVKFQFPIR